MSSANVLQSLVWFSLRIDVDAHVVEYVVCPLPFLKESAQGVGFVCAPASTDIPSSSPGSSITSLHLDKFCETKCVNFVTFAILQIVSMTFVNHEY